MSIPAVIGLHVQFFRTPTGGPAAATITRIRENGHADLAVMNGISVVAANAVPHEGDAGVDACFWRLVPAPGVPAAPPQQPSAAAKGAITSAAEVTA